MKTIILKPIVQWGIVRIALVYPFESVIEKKVRAFPGRMWSRKYRCWFIDFSEEKLRSLIEFLSSEDVTVDAGAFREMTEKRVVGDKKIPVVKLLSIDQRKLLSRFEDWLLQRRYSDRTVSTYLALLKVLFAYHKNIPVQDITHDDIVQFNRHFIVKKKYSISYQRQLTGALKLFYFQIEDHQLNLEKLERPRKEKKIPAVFSRGELEAIIKSIGNLKHQAIISLIYSAGLRAGELINLKIADIDGKRKVINIKSGKGRKDRIVPLSEKILKLLRRYVRAYRPVIYLFEGQKRERYSFTSCRAVLKRAMKRAGIQKRGSLHTLRHSYATHLLESGTDIRYIQKLLGHQSSRTTEIYTHVSNKSLEDIPSSYDSLDLD